jgi:hypothetical protein
MAWGLSWAGTRLGLCLELIVTNWLGIIPEPQSIVEHPFW